MTFVLGCQSDVFVSYAHNDNQDGWVSEFVKKLTVCLNRHVGAASEVFIDKHGVKANHDEDDLTENARNSAVFLAVGSRAYVQREWTRRELEAFVSRGDTKGRLFAIEIVPLREDQEYPGPLKALLGISKFWTEDQAKNPMPLTPTHGAERYRQEVNKVAAEIADKLVKMSKGPPAAAGPAVVVAEAPDLDVQRQQLVGHLKDSGMTVLPDGYYPGARDEFRNALNADLARSVLFVQLLGKSTFRTRDFPEGYAKAQADLASQAKIVTRKWRSLDIGQITEETVPDPDYRALLTAKDVEAGLFEQFKLDVVAHLKRPPPPPPPAPGTLYVNVAPEDEGRLDLTLLSQRAKANGRRLIRSTTVGRRAEVRKDNVNNWRTCQSAIIVYAAGSHLFVRDQINTYLQTRQTPLDWFVVLKLPPKEKPRVDMELPELRWKDLRDGQLTSEIADALVTGQLDGFDALEAA